MKTYLLFILMFAHFVLFSQNADSTYAGTYAGTWEGSLNVQNTKLRILFHLKNDNGTWTATMDSPDQMQYGIKMDTVIINDKGFSLKLKAASAVYSATLNEDAKSVNGNWVQGASYPLDMFKNFAYKPRVYPQEPIGPFPYKSVEVSYENSQAKINIGGTLTLPGEGMEKYPVILLITGSGQQDRNSAIMGHKPFLVIADHFSRRGFAVLRLDDRGIGATTGNPQAATTADFVTDVEAGIKFLKSHPNISADKVFLMGHSEGGIIAVMAAAKQKKALAGIVLLAGPGVPMHELMVKQANDILHLQGLEEEYVKAAVDFNKKLYGEILADKKNKLTPKTLSDKIIPEFKKMPAAAKEALKMNEAAVMQSSVTLLMPWFRYFIKIDPTAYLKKIKCPVLALNGGSDMQVAAGPNLEAICKNIRMKGNTDVMCTEIPGLNHLFQRCKSCTIQEYSELDETFAPEVLKAVETWLQKHCK